VTVRYRSNRRRRLLMLGMLALTALVVVSVVLLHHQQRVSGAPPVTRATVARSSASGNESTASSGVAHAFVRGSATIEEAYPLVDTSRPLMRNGDELASGRSLPITVWRPAATGTFPLVIFVHGFDLGPSDYSRFCTTLAASGYVVVAPSFPLEDPSRGNGLDRTDLPNEATDVSFVITSVLDGSLAAHVRPHAISVVGHSDGADVALMDGYQVGKVDSRVGAIVAIAPDAMQGAVAPPPDAPLLLVHGDADTVVPYRNSQTVFVQVPARRYFLTLIGADHLPPIAGGTPWTPVLDTAVADFLDATVAGRLPPVASLTGRLGASPLVRLEESG
jgi:dienelactone hydrolase